MKAKPSFKSAAASCRTCDHGSEDSFGIFAFRLYHQDVRMDMPATPISEGTIPLSPKQ